MVIGRNLAGSVVLDSFGTGVTRPCRHLCGIFCARRVALIRHWSGGAIWKRRFFSILGNIPSGPGLEPVFSSPSKSSILSSVTSAESGVLAVSGTGIGMAGL